MRRNAEDTARTRASIVASALRTFADVGYHRTTLAMVAARAGVTRGAVYHHFADKPDLYAAVLERFWGERAQEQWPAGDPGLFLESWLHDLREDSRFRDLLAVTMDGPTGADGAGRKGAALADWSERIRPIAVRLAASTGIASDDAVRHLLAWLVGTATLAAADPHLLPRVVPTFSTPHDQGEET